jgi:general stress protein 26
MKIEVQTSPERIQLGALIENMSVAMLTTFDDNGKLVSQPMSPLLMDSHGVIWFFMDVRSNKANQVDVLNLSFSHEDESTYVSLSGKGDVVMDRDLIKTLWTPFARPWFADGVESTNLALLKIMPEIAEYWDAPNSKMVRLFAMAASIVTGKQIGMGEHDVLTNLSAKADLPATHTHTPTPLQPPPLPDSMSS